MVLTASIQSAATEGRHALPGCLPANKMTGGRRFFALGGLLVLFFLAGCAPACRIEVRPPDDSPVFLNTTHTCFSREGDSFRLLAEVPSHADFLSLISPDGGTPAFYFELTLSEAGGKQAAEVRVFIQTHHAVGIFAGTAHAVEWWERGDVVFVRCRVLLMPVPERAFAGESLLYKTDLHIEGEFRLNPKTYERLDTTIRALEGGLTKCTLASQRTKSLGQSGETLLLIRNTASRRRARVNGRLGYRSRLAFHTLPTASHSVGTVARA